MRGHTIPGGQGRKAKTGGLSIKNNDTSRMQLRYSRQRTISHSSSIGRMEKLCHRKRSPSLDSDGSQKSYTIHNDQGVEWMTNQMERKTYPIQPKHQISTRKTRRK